MVPSESQAVRQADNIPGLDAHYIPYPKPGETIGIGKAEGAGHIRMTGHSYRSIGVDEANPVPGKGPIGRRDGDLVGGWIPGSGVGRAPPPDKGVLVGGQIIERWVGVDV